MKINIQLKIDQKIIYEGGGREVIDIREEINEIKKLGEFPSWRSG